MAAQAVAADAVLGRVTSTCDGLVGVLTQDGPVRSSIGGALLAEMARDPVNAPCAGDWVVVRSWPDHRSTVERVLPRRTAVCCTTTGSLPHRHALCANVDGTVVVLASGVRASRRLLALAGASGTAVEALPRDVAAVARVQALVDGRRTIALLGSSARDTAALVDALVGAPVLTARSPGGARVRRQLVALPNGGAVIDMGAARCSHCHHHLRPRTGETGPRR